MKSKYPVELLQHIEAAEDRIPWMYLDSRGNVTCATGHLLADPDAAARLPWTDGDPRVAWETVKRSTPGLKAAAYRSLTTCRLSNEAIDLIRECDLDDVARQIARELSGFSGWPEPVRLALTDMGFNLGLHGLLQYRRMIDYLRAGDYAAASLESGRHGVQAARNEWTARMIASATASTEGVKEILA